MGDPERLIVGADDRRPDESIGTVRLGRFALGLACLFLSTSVLVLAAVPVLATVLPGWSSTVVTSGSMEPALRRGDTVLYRNVGGGELDEGAIVLFGARGHELIHRIVAVDRDGMFTTKGDANSTSDTMPLEPDAVIGKGRVVVPWTGFLRLWWLEGRYDLVLATVAVLLGSLRAAHLALGTEGDPWINDVSAVSPTMFPWRHPLPGVPEHLIDEVGHRRLIRSLLAEREPA